MTERKLAIIEALKAGEPVRIIAERFGWSLSGIHYIAKTNSIRVKRPYERHSKAVVIIAGRKLEGNAIEPSIRVPAPLLRSLGWKGGERVHVEAVDGQIVIRRVMEGDMSDPAPKVAVGGVV